MGMTCNLEQIILSMLLERGSGDGVDDEGFHHAFTLSTISTPSRITSIESDGAIASDIRIESHRATAPCLPSNANK
jgi:hypothetical protein